MQRLLATAATAAAAAALVVGLASPASAGLTDPDPTRPVSMRTTSSNVLLTFYRSTDGSVRLHQRSGAWQGVQGGQLLGGQVSTAPTGMVYLTGNATQYWVVAAGTNGAVYFRRYEVFAPVPEWTPWTSLGGATTSPPALGCGSENAPPLVYVRGSDGALWTRTSAGGGWASLGGDLLTGPATVPSNDGGCYPGPMEVVAIGGDKAVWRWRAAGSGWSRIGGTSTLTPALVKHGDAEYVFAVGTDKALYWAYRSGTFRWSAFTKIGGAFTTAPTAVVWSEKPPYAEDGLTVAALGTNGKLYRATRSLTNPGPWTIEAG